VAENLNDFGLSQEEAIEDAINQLKSQGADLTTICKYPQEEQQELINNLKKLNDLILNLKATTQVTSSDQVKQFIECLNEMTPEKIAWLRTLTRMINNNDLRMVDEECCGEWDAYAFYFNNKKTLCLVHPR
jgi:tyrosine-protein phosphatase YwqE